MNTLDKHYLLLQFNNKIYNASGTEFQSFFESIMEKADSNYQKIKPYGNEGDGGNDGYIKSLGIYYQVYAPNEPRINEKKAINKLKGDYKKLIESGWNEISNIKMYYFVYNDKYTGSTLSIEKAIAEQEKNNGDTKFKILLAKDLERIFFSLDESDILSLGFNIDGRQAIKNAYYYLENVNIELDKENAFFAKKILDKIHDIICDLNDEGLSMEYKILEAKCFEKMEEVQKAKTSYLETSKIYPKDARSVLYLAEICLKEGNFDKNLEYLKEAEAISKNFWLLKLEKLLRKIYVGESIEDKDLGQIPSGCDSKIESDFCRIYAQFAEDKNMEVEANSFIEKAINTSGYKFRNWLAKISILEKRLFKEKNSSRKGELAEELLKLISEVETLFLHLNDIGPRNKVYLNMTKLNAHALVNDFQKYEEVAKFTFEEILKCYYDKQIEQVIAILLKFIVLPDDDFDRLLNYIKKSKKEISDELCKVIICQFNIKNRPLKDSQKFFGEINNQDILTFLKNVEEKNYQKVLDFIDQDIFFGVMYANTLKSIPELRKLIIENLPNSKNIQKEKLQLLLNFDEEDFDQAFDILKKINLSELSYLECEPILHIIQKKNAWDFEIIILKKLIENEKDIKYKFKLELQLFNAFSKLEKYTEAIKLGEKLLKTNERLDLLDAINKEVLLTNTIISLFERSKIDENANKKAEEILLSYPLDNPSFEFKVGVESEVFLNNNQPQKALTSFIEGVKIKKLFTPQEYAKLFFQLSTKIGNRINLELISLESVENDSFVKLKNKEQWYYMGEDNELDAIKISKTNRKYKLFIEKGLKDTIQFNNKYSSEVSEYGIEYIYNIEQYILWQVVNNFQKLSKEGDLDGVLMIEVPQEGDSINPENLLKVLADLKQPTEPFFELYLKNNIPLAMLAVNEGSIMQAIGRIQNEGKGFINFSDGTLEEFEKQKDNARLIIEEGGQFYIDGTSIIFLAESGYLEKVFQYIPNLKVPQSVIGILTSLSERFTYMPGHVGYMGYVKGKINYSNIDKDIGQKIKMKINKCIKLLEDHPHNIEVISDANKIDCFSEKKVPNELCDACILAQRDNIPVMTEDFLYLKLNELETKKEVPIYFSSLALIRVLLESGKISINDYLSYFGYLSTYRFRFLSLNSDDIVNAVLGDKKLKTFDTENIKKFNLQLTLSEQYGVPLETSLKLVSEVLHKIIKDNSITEKNTTKLFIEMLEAFPNSIDKKTLGQILIGICLRRIDNSRSKIIIQPRNDLIHKKVEELYKTTELYSIKSLV